MANRLRNLLSGGAGAATRLGDIGLLLLRVGTGLGIAIGHGWGKVYQKGSIGPSADFITGVEQMGFPAPTAFAWMAAITEFVGGLLLAAGLMTRPVALLLVCNMATAAFIRHAKDDLFGMPGKEFALLYLLPFLLFVFTGAGRYSADRMLRKDGGAA